MKGELSYVSIYATEFTIVKNSTERDALSRGKWSRGEEGWGDGEIVGERKVGR
jgi:hypothetical protein